MAISIRHITGDDVRVVADLSRQLDYTISEEDTLRQIRLITESGGDAGYVAVEDGRVIGWMHVFYALRIESQPFCEVGGLVVDERYRGKGIGKMLVKKAVEWCATKECKRLVVRSNVKRADAHKFYEASGFKEAKEQKVFRLMLP